MVQKGRLFAIEFENEWKVYIIHQSLYIKEVCNRFKRIVYSKVQYLQSNAVTDEMLQRPYRNVLGCPVYR